MLISKLGDRADSVFNFEWKGPRKSFSSSPAQPRTVWCRPRLPFAHVHNTSLWSTCTCPVWAWLLGFSGEGRQPQPVRKPSASLLIVKRYGEGFPDPPFRTRCVSRISGYCGISAAEQNCGWDRVTAGFNEGSGHRDEGLARREGVEACSAPRRARRTCS